MNEQAVIFEDHCFYDPSQTQYLFQIREESDNSYIAATQDPNLFQEHILDYLKLADYHVRLAVIMNNHHQLDTSLILCHRALHSVLGAIYVQENRSLDVPYLFTMEEILRLVHVYSDSSRGLDIAIFIGTVQHLSEVGVRFEVNINGGQRESVQRLIQRTKETMDELSGHLLD
ncbi:hypothetical protein [Paenibacillus massiliensis]|uniref:hypothetical protein n=1 Tax=Paenibacillus massiliensis TaxID=225917 RepID=UPI0003658A25|nr:hypothetical protein [Paenibacillus massiliensis]